MLQFEVIAVTIIDMEAIYRLNTREMGIDFVNSVKIAYPDQSIEITIRKQDDVDDTEYLNSSPANREQLLNAIKEVEEGKIISFETLEDARKCAEEETAKQ